MNRFVILALVAAAGVSARSIDTLEGASRGLKCVGTKCTSSCEVKTTVIANADLEFKIRHACSLAVEKMSTAICADASGAINMNTNITKTLSVMSKAVGKAVSEASIAIFSGVSYKGSCDYGSQGKVKATAVAAAWAKVAAEATAQALVKVYGKNALDKTGIWIDATSVAITKACAKAVVKGFSEYTYPVGPAYTAGWVTFTQAPVTAVTQAVATAIATAYVDVVAQITIDVDAKKFPCDFVCPKCPPL